MGSFSYGGTDLADYGVTIAPESERDLIPEVREHIIEIPGKDGFYDYDPELGPRYFRLRCFCQADTHANLVTNLLALETILDPKLGTKKLTFDTISGKYWNARLTSTVTVKIYGRHADLLINFICPDPTTQTE